MKKTLAFISCLSIMGIFFFACQPDQKSVADTGGQAADAKPAMTKADSIKRGEYLITSMGCNDCHTPKMMTDHGPDLDRSRMLSGHPASEALPKMPDKSFVAPGQWILMSSGITSFTGPWGTSFAANLTPDESGIGNWTYDNFKTAIRKGKFKGQENGRPLLPPMPWPNLTNLTEEDYANMWIYLRSLPPVKNVVPTALPPA